MRHAHGVGEGVIPGALVLDRVALWIAGGQCFDQRAFRALTPSGQRHGSTGGIIGAGKRRGLADGVHQFPGKVIVRPDRVADTPMGHGTVRVGLQRLFEAGDSLLVVIAEAPVEATVEPALGVRRAGGHRPGIGAEIIGIVHVASSTIVGAAGKLADAPCVRHIIRDRTHAALFTDIPQGGRLRALTEQYPSPAPFASNVYGAESRDRYYRMLRTHGTAAFDQEAGYSPALPPISGRTYDSDCRCSIKRDASPYPASLRDKKRAPTGCPSLSVETGTRWIRNPSHPRPCRLASHHRRPASQAAPLPLPRS